jgi:hypothetical protein
METVKKIIKWSHMYQATSFEVGNTTLNVTAPSNWIGWTALALECLAIVIVGTYLKSFF